MNRIIIAIPPLRQRKQDIQILTEYFFHHFKEKEKTKLISVETKVMEIFQAYPWPGNIRELKSAIWGACTKARLFGDTKLQVKHLKQELQEPSPYISLKKC